MTAGGPLAVWCKGETPRERGFAFAEKKSKMLDKGSAWCYINKGKGIISLTLQPERLRILSIITF
jgi:hypothetical protein